MSPEGQALLIYTLLILFFGSWYFLVRSRLNRGLRYRSLFLCNLIYGIAILFPLPFLAFQRFNITNQLLMVCLIIMVIASLIHHLSLILLFSSKKKRPRLEFIHGPISHFGLGIPFIFAGILAALSFYPRITGNIDLSIFIFWFIVVEAFALLMIICGLRLVKW